MAKNKREVSGWFEVIWVEISGFFVIMFDKVWGGFTDVFWSIMSGIPDFLAVSFRDNLDKWWNAELENWLKEGLIDTQSRGYLRRIEKYPFFVYLVAALFTTAAININYLKQLMYILSGDIRRKLNRENEPENIDAMVALQASLVDPKKIDIVQKVLQEAGFPDEQIALLFLTFHRMQDEGTVKDLYHRAIITEAEAIAKLKNLGYTEERIKQLMAAYPMIPGPGDLFHLVAKEAFEPDIIEHYGYAEEFPEEQVKWLKAQGISRYWAEKYWYAHWETPSIGQGFEMLHRGVIGFDELEVLFRTVEIPPFWREKLTRIAFMPYTRVDVRRMHKLGVITDEILINAYMDLGYDEEHAVKMADFTIRYNAKSDRDLTKTEILKGFAEGIIPYNEAIAMLIDMDYDETEAAYLIEYENYKVSKELENMLLKNIQSKYQRNIIDSFQAREALSNLNLSGERITLLMDKWEIERKVDERLPSKADLDKFVAAKIITVDVYYIEMKKLGYPDKYIEMYQQLSATAKKG